jgi:AcrR family transcriptional regulator
MPKLVDHEARRKEIVEATWRLIRSKGPDGLTMRQIAAEAGFANGALKHYFPDRDAILLAAHQRVIAGTSERITAVTEGLSGLAALRALCLELMPVDELTVAEAHVVVAFWAMAASNPTMLAQYHKLHVSLNRYIDLYVREAREQGEITTTMCDDDIASALGWMIRGLQSRVLLFPDEATPQRQIAVLDAFIANLTD